MVILVRWKAPEIHQVYKHTQSPPPSALSCGFCMLDLFMAVSSMQGGRVLHRLHPSLSATPFPGHGTVLTPIFLQHVIEILSTFQCFFFKVIFFFLRPNINRFLLANTFPVCSPKVDQRTYLSYFAPDVALMVASESSPEILGYYRQPWHQFAVFDRQSLWPQSDVCQINVVLTLSIFVQLKTEVKHELCSFFAHLIGHFLNTDFIYFVINQPRFRLGWSFSRTLIFIQ